MCTIGLVNITIASYRLSKVSQIIYHVLHLWLGTGIVISGPLVMHLRFSKRGRLICEYGKPTNVQFLEYENVSTCEPNHCYSNCILNLYDSE